MAAELGIPYSGIFQTPDIGEYILTLSARDLTKNVDPSLRFQTTGSETPSLETEAESISRLSVELQNLFQTIEASRLSNSINSAGIPRTRFEEQRIASYTVLLDKVASLMHQDIYAAARLTTAIRSSGVLERYDLRSGTMPSSGTSVQLFERFIGESLSARLVAELERKNMPSVEFVLQEAQQHKLIRLASGQSLGEYVGTQVFHYRLKHCDSFQKAMAEFKKDKEILQELRLPQLWVNIDEEMEEQINRSVIHDIEQERSSLFRTDDRKGRRVLRLVEDASWAIQTVQGVVEDQFRFSELTRSLIESALSEGVTYTISNTHGNEAQKALRGLHYYGYARTGVRGVLESSYEFPESTLHVLDHALFRGVASLVSDTSGTPLTRAKAGLQFCAQVQEATNQCLGSTYQFPENTRILITKALESGIQQILYNSPEDIISKVRNAFDYYEQRRKEGRDIFGPAYDLSLYCKDHIRVSIIQAFSYIGYSKDVADRDREQIAREFKNFLLATVQRLSKSLDDHSQVK